MMKTNFHIRFGLLFLILNFYCNPYSLPEDKSIDINETAYAHYQKGVEYYNSGEFDEALAAVNEAISHKSTFAQFYQLRGDIYSAQNKFQSALESYEEAIKYRSNFTVVYQSKGEIYLKMKQYDDALKAFKKVRANNPLELFTNLYIAQCYMELNELEVAYNDLADYRRLKLVSGEELDSEYYRLLGITYFRFKRYKDAIIELEVYQKFEPEDTEILFILGKSYYQTREFEKGLSYFNRLIKIDDTNGKWYLFRGIYFYQKNDFSDAESQLNYALELDNTLYDAHLFLGKIYEQQGKVELALKHLHIYRNSMRELIDSNELENLIFELESMQKSTSENN